MPNSLSQYGPREPLAHKVTHQNAGTDEISVAGLSGVLADSQLSSWSQVSGKPSTFAPSAHKASHQDGGSDEIDATGLVGAGGGPTDRGDPAAYDWTQADFTQDATWRDLDCSSIVPAGKTFILLLGYVLGTAGDKTIYFRKKGNANSIIIPGFTYNVANYTSYFQLLCACDVNRKIQYYISAGSFTTIRLAVAAYS